MQCHDRASAQTDKVAIRHIVILQQREDVAIDNLGTHNHRTALVVLQRIQSLFEALRQLELQLPRRLLHILLQIAAHWAQVTLQHLLHHREQLTILLLALITHARGFAVAQMVLQADAIFALGDVLRCKI